METTGTQGKECGCGCGALVRKSFLPGHDARLKGRLIREARDATLPKATRMAAVEAALVRGWGRYIAADDLNDLTDPAKLAKSVDSTDRRRRVDVCHIDALATLCTDKANVSHAHGECPEISGAWHRHDANDAQATGWLCPTCILTHTLAERVANQRLNLWVFSKPDSITDGPEVTTEQLDGPPADWKERAA